MKLIELENKHYDKLNQNERDILLFINQNKDFVKNASLEKIAAKTHFSKSAIFRLCQKLGLNGYSQLKYLLEDESHIIQPAHDEPIDFVSQSVKSVLWVANQFRNSQLNDAYQTIEEAPHVYIYSTGWVQEIVAEQLKRNLYLTNKLTYDLPHAKTELKMMITNAEPKDILMIISYSGMNPTLLEAVEELTYSGIRTIAFTSLRQNELSKIVTYNFYYETIKKKISNKSEVDFFGNLFILIDLFSMGYIKFKHNKESLNE
ncbi:MurR/RpiR family transcriptional regulator [Xylocopilactobacillus apicola]|uniref:Transcriptional regulator n=1 Tax=Xylocopilactobacillus apicola TaxID=2932184 RepID=A0AAU9DPZ6_9LACO|nr:MurR/RpiR family transcriptional regulator [Xylocopilactobacillus apicola]BDR57904.1 transcriptional regulator [Xylocopilactobacillus apicola]